ncbi:paired amphipathic helix protein Sin3b-like [Oryza brachyantha]|uniref:Histone deacetylase interacting domain-containing protein n=1 Tax=Oryza brachyantha TaxID=4533 RepID=J3LF42_ORYBR|nr:paired amphipathic helix protein Sin3b-like [Oryza brachyantha]
MAHSTLAIQEYCDAASNFLRKVKLRFISRPDVYEGLTDVLRGYGKNDDAPASSTVDSVAKLLRHQPDLIADFNAFLPPDYQIKVAHDNYATATKPGGSRDERKPGGSRDGRQRRVAGADVELELKAHRLLMRLEVEDGELYNRLTGTLSDVHKKSWLNAHEVYTELEQVFGPAGRRDLLQLFSQFLPNSPPSHFAEERLEQDHRPSSKRKRAASPCAVTADAVVKPSRAKKPRAANPLQISPHANGDVFAKPIKTKKPHATVDLQDGEDDDSCWHVATNNPHDAAVPFGKMLKFFHRYSNLVATMKRAEELERTQHPQGAFEVLFPDRECHQILAELYGDGWRTMQVALEDGERVDVTLAMILLRLKAKEDATVEVAWARRDKSRYP